jgi:hypothetical protein
LIPAIQFPLLFPLSLILFKFFKIVATPQLSFQVVSDLSRSSLPIRQFFSPLNLMPDALVKIEEYEFHSETDGSECDTDTKTAEYAECQNKDNERRKGLPGRGFCN